MRICHHYLRFGLLILLLVGYSSAQYQSSTSGAVSYALTNEGTIPGLTNKGVKAAPGDNVKVIVLFDNLPAAEYRASIMWGGARLTAQQQTQVRAYGNQLRLIHNQFLRRAAASGTDLVVNHQYTHLLNGLALTIRVEDIDWLLTNPEIEAVYPDPDVFLEPNTSTPINAFQAARNTLTAEGSPLTGQGVSVAVIDTGIDYTHPDLGGCFGSGCKVVDGYDLRNGDADPLDDNGHGTHCAGIVGADGVFKGVAPGVSLYAYKVLDAKGFGSMSTVIAGIERAADPDQDPGTSDAVNIISLSLGSAGSPDDPWSLAVDAAVAAGVSVVVSAGNSGPEYGSIGSPGVARKAFAVGATNSSNTVADFSSRGPVPGFDQLMKPQVTAPGVDISSTWLAGGYKSQSGTSMAAPYAAGAAALVLQAHPAWPPAMVQSLIMNNALDLASNIYTQGAGKVQIADFFNVPAVVSPGLVGLGLVDPNQPVWTASQPLQITNPTAETRDYTLEIVQPLSPGAAVTLEPYSLTLGAGESGSFTLSVAVDTAMARPDMDGNEGRVLVQSGTYQAAIPFVFRVPGLFPESYALPYGVQTSFGVELGDLDGDGDDDAFIANTSYYGSPADTVWLNHGEGLFSDSGQRLGDSFSWAVDLGDLDGDGDLDAFVANSEPEDPLPDRVWFNDGAGFFTPSPQSLGNTSSRDVKLGDLDGDGDLDAFVANSRFKRGIGEANRVWLNNGQGHFVDSGQSLDNSLSQAVALGDLDGDNDLDAFVANGVADREYGRANTVWINNGHGRFTNSGQSLGDSISQDVALGDLDGDGDLDAFVANGGLYPSEGQPDRIWLNNGSAIFTDSGQRLGNASSHGVALADFYGDGYLDAFVAGYQGGNKVWINDTTGKMHLSAPGFGSESATAAAAGDVDGDGDIDALTAVGLGKQNRIWFNQGGRNATTGKINVVTNRGDAVWRIDGPESSTGRSSRLIDGVPVGIYRITWGTALGCTTPGPVTKTLVGGESINFEGEYADCPPSAPKLNYPEHLSRTDATPTLGWVDMAGPTAYRLQLDNNPDFSSPEVDQTISDETYTVKKTLSAGNTYWRVRSTNPNGDSAWSEVRKFIITDVIPLPFNDGFEAPDLSAPWHIFTTADGRVQVSAVSAYAGSQSLLLDDSLANDSYSVSAAELMINLEGQSGVALSFWWRNWRDGNQYGQSGVFISSDYGRKWHRVSAFEGLMPAFQAESIDIARAAAEHGLALNDHFLVRFQSFGDDPFSTGGGHAVDEVSLTAGPEAPTNLTLALISEDQIDLKWQDNASDESAYHIERLTDSGTDFAKIGTVPADTTAFSDKGLSCGARYVYRVRAYRAEDGTYSAYSNSAAATTHACRYLQYLPAVTSSDHSGEE